jgi:hypothetical protein
MVDLKAFNEYRKRMNERILGTDNLEIKRFWALDSRAYEEGRRGHRRVQGDGEGGPWPEELSLRRMRAWIPFPSL